jgi:hypothetical protein
VVVSLVKIHLISRLDVNELLRNTNGSSHLFMKKYPSGTATKMDMAITEKLSEKYNPRSTASTRNPFHPVPVSSWR